MSSAKRGDKVTVHYHGTLQDGTVFSSTRESEPLQFTIGQDQIIPGFEEAVVGMTEGEKKNFKLNPDQAYGDYHEDKVFNVPKDQIPNDINPEKGMSLQVQPQEGEALLVKVVNLDEQVVTLDANHPLAGEDLYFDIELLAVETASE